MKALKFTISGDFITEFSRTRFLESGNINVGTDILTKSLSGLDKETARQVVLGKKRLVGDNIVTLEDDDTKVVPDNLLCKRPIEDCLCGWLSTDGNAYGFEYYNQSFDHCTLAERLVNYGVVEHVEDDVTFERSVEVAGYIKFGPELIVAACPPSMITERQRDAVIRFMDAHRIYSVKLGYWNEGLTSRTFIHRSEILQFANRLTQ